MIVTMTLPRQRPQGPPGPTEPADAARPADRARTAKPPKGAADRLPEDLVGRAAGPAAEGLYTGVEFRTTVDDSDTPYDVVDALLLTPFTTGAQPHARHSRLDSLREDATLVPADGKILRSVV